MLRFRRFSRVILKVFKILLVCVKELTNSKSSGYEDDGKLGWCGNDLFFTCEFQGRQVPELLLAGWDIWQLVSVLQKQKHVLTFIEHMCLNFISPTRIGGGEGGLGVKGSGHRPPWKGGEEDTVLSDDIYFWHTLCFREITFLLVWLSSLFFAEGF